MLIFIARAASSLVLGNVKHFVRKQSYPSEEFTAWLRKDQEQGGYHYISSSLS